MRKLEEWAGMEGRLQLRRQWRSEQRILNRGQRRWHEIAPWEMWHLVDRMFEGIRGPPQTLKELMPDKVAAVPGVGWRYLVWAAPKGAQR